MLFSIAIFIAALSACSGFTGLPSIKLEPKAQSENVLVVQALNYDYDSTGIGEGRDGIRFDRERTIDKMPEMRDAFPLDPHKKYRINYDVDVQIPRVVTTEYLDIGQKCFYCRCWKSKRFPYCDGAHVKHNEEHADNVGPIIVNAVNQLEGDYHDPEEHFWRPVVPPIRG
mmetsp:Transcript_20589/g.29796  ORF Transcript_20589/g.29796 Transcript_20589/m.29796 type:complete len:170 (+) Transcript_20589:80-589(+)|eukprot:CAMPEP_0113944524 /NCGR_PEP_ID=MMETSP1339-20121228/34477_1 /TAXON_ID=94617 /ORGANISM="Fibrocapsa japonica" /LENGTH=169 /DNA_ID=CAMNT_0000949755 /DNA_START=78 /DNA_END=587 /DNA_ORIENTATION=- /assembly_acc=CAM_ASM_000762